MRGERCGLADRREWEGDPSDTCVGRTRLKVEDPGMPGAHRNHSFHRRDHGRVEAQRLIERPRVLSSHKEGIHDAGREVRAGRQAGVGRRPKRHTHGERARLRVGDPGTRGAHLKHSFHSRDLGRVEAQRLIERPCVLSSHKEGICEAGGEVCGLGGARA